MPTKNSIIIIIHVTAADIRSGQTCAPKTCPVARAFARAAQQKFPKLKDWGVGDYYLRIAGKMRIIFPNRVTAWIAAFDNGASVRPFRFTLNMPK